MGQSSLITRPPANAPTAAEVDAAGAVMNTDTSTAAMSFVIDEDSMATNSATKVPTQQSVKAYVDANSGNDPNAFHDDESGEIIALSSSALAVDTSLLGESAAGAKARYTGANVAKYVTTYSYLLGTYAEIQAITPTVGQRAYPTDRIAYDEFRCLSAGVWTPFFRGIKCTLPPSTGWTAYNSGSVAANADGSRTLTLPAEIYTGNGLRGEYRTRPSDPTSTPYTVTTLAVASWRGTAANTGVTGLMFTDGTGTAGLLIGSGNGLTASRYSAPATFVANDAAIASVVPFPAHQRIMEDATLRHFYVGDAAGSWDELGSGFTRTTGFTATSVGWYGISGDADMTLSITLLSWEES